MDPQDRLREARTSRGLEIAEAARRSGVAESMVRAIEDGRFDDLPAGIYARAAIRSYAASLGLDAEEILSACGPGLPAVDDPIAAIGRLRGIRTAGSLEPPRGTSGRAQPSDPSPRVAHRPDWRLPAGSAVDASLIGALLAALTIAAALVARVPPAALGGASAAGLGVMALLVGGSYFFWCGGIIGRTGGERWTGQRSATGPHPVTLSDIGRRAAHAATADARFLLDLGAWSWNIHADLKGLPVHRSV